MGTTNHATRLESHRSTVFEETSALQAADEERVRALTAERRHLRDLLVRGDRIKSRVEEANLAERPAIDAETQAAMSRWLDEVLTLAPADEARARIIRLMSTWAVPPQVAEDGLLEIDSILLELIAPLDPDRREADEAIEAAR